MISKRNIILFGIFIMLNISVLFSNDSIKCSSVEIFKNHVAQNPSLLIKQQELEIEIQKWISNNDLNRLSATQAVIIIPVVVHVVYNTTTQNISDAQILSQFNVLNKDFRNLNADKLLSTHPYYSLTGDANIEFCLAKIDPNGNATTGITRTSTTQTEFNGNPSSTANEKIKFTSKGGKDNWDPTKYLNIWIGKLNGGTLGYAQFPSDLGSEAATDGVVIDYRYFGTTGTVSPPFDLGRTATHEIGHWLNLNHIWGDENCGDDEVSDTPEQESENYDCPTFPSVTCSNGPNGDMFMNYMDYTDDGCMSLFTKGQVTRMTATLNTARVAIKTSNKCSSTTTGIVQQQLEQIKIYPNPIQNYLTIEGLPKTISRTYNIDIFNILGEKVYAIVIENTQVQLEMQNLVKGTYIMNIYNDEFSFMQKLVVVK